MSLGGIWLPDFLHFLRPYYHHALSLLFFQPFYEIYINIQQGISSCHLDIAMCLLTYTTYQCAHTDLILSRFCQGYAVTQRKSQCQDIRTRQAFMNHTQHTHPACRLTSDAGDIFRNHAVCHRYALVSNFLGYCDPVCSLLII